ncbi:hypothetical protein IU402_04690 [Aerococcaceae bacterium zg-BR9]|uniref:hypothetical protein n=1 Tax=Aerococcaceae bacterium zg-1292 TaxID=2774330 RepID=UPI0040633EC4|nr:hypothetical protein [Aerococcaceae bacterium zg-BR9]
MGIFDLFRRKKESKAEINSTQSISQSEDFVGVRLSTQTTDIMEPTKEQINQATQHAINTFDEFVLVEWRSPNREIAFLQGIGFGTSYRLEYVPVGAQSGFAYVVEGVSLEDAMHFFNEFAEQHKINFDATWQWKAIV